MIYTFSPGCPQTGQISILDIANELQISSTGLSLQAVSINPLNPYSPSKPNGVAPHGIDEFRGYKHRSVGLSLDVVNLYSYANGESLNYSVWPAADLVVQSKPFWVTVNIASASALVIEATANTGASRTGIVALTANGVVAYIEVNQDGNGGGIEL